MPRFGPLTRPLNQDEEEEASIMESAFLGALTDHDEAKAKDNVKKAKGFVDVLGELGGATTAALKQGIAAVTALGEALIPATMSHQTSQIGRAARQFLGEATGGVTNKMEVQSAAFEDALQTEGQRIGELAVQGVHLTKDQQNQVMSTAQRTNELFYTAVQQFTYQQSENKRNSDVEAVGRGIGVVARTPFGPVLNLGGLFGPGANSPYSTGETTNAAPGF